jgi:hypothetical protein
MLPNKVVSHVSGGLGNQMFQFMAGYALAAETERELVLNYNWFKNPKFLYKNDDAHKDKREIGIEAFTSVHNSRVDESLTPRDGRFERLTQKLDRYSKGLIGIASEENFVDGTWLDPAKIKRLVGVFMSPKYFLGTKPSDVFGSLSFGVSDWCSRLVNDISNTASIGVHIRLGDYERLGEILIPEEIFYLNGIEVLRSELRGDPEVVVFSDDPLRLQERFPSLAKIGHIVSPPAGTTPVESLLALSKSSAFVCSNSSFSWWGSVLNNTPASLIVRPSYFYARGSEQVERHDLWFEDSARIHPLSGKLVSQ